MEGRERGVASTIRFSRLSDYYSPYLVPHRVRSGGDPGLDKRQGTSGGNDSVFPPDNSYVLQLFSFLFSRILKE